MLFSMSNFHMFYRFWVPKRLPKRKDGTHFWACFPSFSGKKVFRSFSMNFGQLWTTKSTKNVEKRYTVERTPHKSKSGQKGAGGGSALPLQSAARRARQACRRTRRMYLPHPAGNVGHADMHVLREGAALAVGRATASPFGG